MNQIDAASVRHTKKKDIRIIHDAPLEAEMEEQELDAILNGVHNEDRYAHLKGKADSEDANSADLPNEDESR